MEARELLVRAAWLVLLGVQLAFSQGCSTHREHTPREHKWLFYDLQNENDVLYQGYTVTKGEAENTDTEGTVRKLIKELKKPPGIKAENTATEGTVQKLIQEIKPPGIIVLDKPTIDEDDQLHFVFYGPRSRVNSENVLCKFTETPYAQSHDAKMAPPSPKPRETTLADAQANRKQAEVAVERLQASVESARQTRQSLEQQAVLAEKRQKQNPKSLNLSRLAEEARDKEQEAESAQLSLELELAQAERQLIKASREESAAIVCDLDVREKGGNKILHTLAALQSDKTEKILFEDTVLVHELYRFRVLAGPVFSTVQKRNKTYSLQQNSLGQNEVTASAASTSPANFALMLKTYLFAKRDLLDPPSLISSRWYEMINPVIGINLLDNPLENLYAGLSLELAGGFDIVGGVHWAKTEQLTGGFSKDQTTSQSNLSTKERFTNGWFVGVAADIGIITTWLKSAGSGILSATQTTP